MLLRKLGERVLWSRAREYVEKYKPILIGVTGSYGKTLTKEAIALALTDDRHVRASHKSYNTPIGVALSILGLQSAADRRGWIHLLADSFIRERAEGEPDTIVLELGADRPGDIDWLVQQVSFRIGVVTNIGSTHLQLFVSKEMVAHEKLSLAVALAKDGTAILNSDDPLVIAMREYIKAPVMTFGEAEEADVRLVRADRLGVKGFALGLAIGSQKFEVALPHIIGRHQLQSVLAAIAVARVENVKIQRAINNLRSLKPPPGRLRMFEGVGGSVILDDSYNAAPESTIVSLKTLEALPAKRRIAILGDMRELGAHSFRFHEEVGKKAAEVADVFIAVGQDMRHAQAAALESEHPVDAHHFPTSRDVGKWMGEFLHTGDVVLVKGSRAMRMERAVKRLLADPNRDQAQLVH
jgi:UDP-N-acetylmuramyl pentapeptide synthase